VNGPVRKWVTIYLVVLATMLLISKYPYLLRGEAPAFSEGEFLKTLVMAALGAALVWVIEDRMRELKERLPRRRRKP